MTLIQFKFAIPSKTGVDVPQGGWIECKPTRKRIITGEPDTVILPDSFIAHVPGTGVLDQDLAATGPSWCWELVFSSFGVPTWTEYVAVPEVGPVDFTDLVRVDPSTLEPSAEPIPAWWAGVDEMKQAAAEAAVLAAAAAAAATSAATSATEAEQDANAASAAAGTIIEMTETGRLSTTALSDTIGELSGPVIDQKVAPVLDAANGAAQSAAGSEAAALDVVTRADRGEFKGEQGADGNATMRVDTTVGTRIFITDGVTEHMLSGDTKWRSVVLSESANVASGEIRWRRVNEKVYLAFRGVLMKSGAGYTPLPFPPPIGFRQIPGDRVMQSIGLTTNATSLQTISLFTGSVAWLYQISGGVVNTARPTTDSLQGTVSWNTDDAWPTTLPGIPA